MNTNHLDEEQLYYKNKYLKYKKKYLVLKKELKGGQEWWEVVGKAAGNTWGHASQAVGDTVGHATKAVDNTIGHATKAGDAFIKTVNDGIQEQAQARAQTQAQAQAQISVQPRQVSERQHYMYNNRIINFLVELILSQFCSNTILNEKNDKNENKIKCPYKNKINTIIKCPDKYKNNNYNETKGYIKLFDGKATRGIFDTSCVVNFNVLESTTNVNNTIFHRYICNYYKKYSNSRVNFGYYDILDFKLYDLTHNLKYYENQNQNITALEYLINEILNNFIPLIIVEGEDIVSTKKYLINKVKEFIKSEEFSAQITFQGPFKDNTRTSC